MREAEAAVLGREADAGEAAVPQPPLQRPLVVAAALVLVVAARHALERRHVVGQPRPGPRRGTPRPARASARHDAAPSRRVAMRSACSSGVP